VTDRYLVALRPMPGRHDREIRSVEEHSSRRQVVPGRAFAHTIRWRRAMRDRTQGKCARLAALWGVGKVLQSPRARMGRDAGAGQITGSTVGARTGELTARSMNRTWRAAEGRWVWIPVPQSPTATMRLAMGRFKAECVRPCVRRLSCDGPPRRPECRDCRLSLAGEWSERRDDDRNLERNHPTLAALRPERH
jgi:hypothetical protein